MAQMNIQLANVLSDVSGMTGQAIIKAILAGERDPHALAALRDWRVKAGEEEIARSLEGNWQEDQLFVLKQEQDSNEFCQKQIAQCDQLLQQYLLQQEDRSQGASLPEEKRRERLRKKKKGNAPQFDPRTELFRMTGADLTQIDAIDVTTAMTILSEAGSDMSKMENGEPFCILAAAVSRQSNQRRQNHWQRETTDQESGQYRLANGSQHLTAKQYILGSAVSPIANQARGPRCD
jgi:transposase